ncbi:aminotransferase class V [Paraburkholderia sp. BL6669N2]|nr:aminotransferase class V [Paraburkholderia sp. BL6669N2]
MQTGAPVHRSRWARSPNAAPSRAADGAFAGPELKTLLLVTRKTRNAQAAQLPVRFGQHHIGAPPPHRLHKIVQGLAEGFRHIERRNQRLAHLADAVQRFSAIAHVNPARVTTNPTKRTAAILTRRAHRHKNNSKTTAAQLKEATRAWKSTGMEVALKVALPRFQEPAMSDFQRVSTGLHPRGANPVHLGHVATTPVDRRVIRRMLPYRTEMYGNSASRSHAYGWVGEKTVELAREQVSSFVNGDPHEIVWTSGATESNNLATKGAAHLHRAKGNPLVTLTTEHQSVLGAMLELDRDGLEVTVLPVQESGLVDLAAIGALCRARGILPHVCRAGRQQGAYRSRRFAGRSDVALGSLDRRPQRHWRAVRGAPAAHADRVPHARRRPRAQHALGDVVHASDRRGTAIAAGRDPMLGSRRGRDQGGVSDFRSRQTVRGAAADDL